MSGARSGAVSMMVRKSKDKRQQESLLAAFKVETRESISSTYEYSCVHMDL